MLLAMDIGNTNVKIGIFKGDELAYTWRVSTVASFIFFSLSPNIIV